jgi:hypothetical protein
MEEDEHFSSYHISLYRNSKEKIEENPENENNFPIMFFSNSQDKKSMNIICVAYKFVQVVPWKFNGHQKSGLL